MKRKRPFGVTVIAILQVVAAPTAGITVALAESPLGLGRAYDELGGIAGPVYSILGIVIAVGLWRLQRWAWIAAMLWFGLSMVGSLLAYRNGEPYYALMVIEIITVFYLNQRDVQQVFRSRRDQAAAHV
ncbi:MAG: hypothetical protein ACRDJE_18995 [Dehalococcoidia bacterium]